MEVKNNQIGGHTSDHNNIRVEFEIDHEAKRKHRDDGKVPKQWLKGAAEHVRRAAVCCTSFHELACKLVTCRQLAQVLVKRADYQEEYNSLDQLKLLKDLMRRVQKQWRVRLIWTITKQSQRKIGLDIIS